MAYNKRSYKKEEKDEFDKKPIDIRRVTRVTGGGKRFTFRVTVVAGNKKGKNRNTIGKKNRQLLFLQRTPGRFISRSYHTDNSCEYMI